MKEFRADLHIHTLLSPCADLEMTPRNIVARAIESKLNIIGITDHNSTKNALLVKKLGERAGIYTLTGVEVTTREEVHCLAFFEFASQLENFQQFIDKYITLIPNSESDFGYQPIIDEDENIVEMIPNYLPAALQVGISRVQQKVDELEGLFIPAHVDRPLNGIFGQLGFIPPGLKYDALEISMHASEKYVIKHYVLQYKTTLIRNSDAHFLKQIGEICTIFKMDGISFSEIRKALNQREHRYCKLT